MRSRTLLALAAAVAALGATWCAAWTIVGYVRLSEARADLVFVTMHLRDAGTLNGQAVLEHRLRHAEVESAAAKSAMEAAGGSTLAWVPFLGLQLEGAGSIASDLERGVQVGRSTLATCGALVGRTMTTVAALNVLPDCERAVQSGANQLLGLRRSAAGLLGPLRRARLELNAKLVAISERLRHVGDGAIVADGVLGAHGGKNVLVLAANNAEMRAEGAFLSYVLLRVDHGVVRAVRGGSVSTLGDGEVHGALPVTAPFFLQNGASERWSQVNVTSNFKWTGAAAVAMFRSRTGVKVDDVVAIDVPALADLLAATGPVPVRGLSPMLTQMNAAPSLLHSLYLQYAIGSEDQRRAVLSDVTRAVLQRVLSLHHDRLAIARALGAALPGRHLLVYSTSPSVEHALDDLGASGSLEDRGHATLTVAVEGVEATKMDAYDIHTSMAVTIQPAGGTKASITERITVENLAPRRLPATSYIYGPDTYYNNIAGNYLANCFAWFPRGSVVGGSSADGPSVVTGGSLSLKPGQTGSLVLRAVAANAVHRGHLQVTFLPQPRLQPMGIAVRILDAKGRMLERVAGPLDSPLSFDVPLSR